MIQSLKKHAYLSCVLFAFNSSAWAQSKQKMPYAPYIVQMVSYLNELSVAAQKDRCDGDPQEKQVPPQEQAPKMECDVGVKGKLGQEGLDQGLEVRFRQVSSIQPIRKVLALKGKN